MISLKSWMELISYRIGEGTPYTWDCYGPNAHCLDSTYNANSAFETSIVFDTLTQTVYEAIIHDNVNSRCYRLINPDFWDAYVAESKVKNVSVTNAYDDVDYADLETEEDFIEKATAIIAGQPYDDRIVVPLDLDKDTLFSLMCIAHENDITLNKMFEQVVSEYIAEINHPVIENF